MGRSLGSLTACLDRALRIIGGVPAYLLTDNAKTVTVEHVAGIPVRHPDMVALGRHDAAHRGNLPAVHPESKGGTEATVKIAKADLVPALANLLADYAEFFVRLEPTVRPVQPRERPGAPGKALRSLISGWPPSGSICIRCRRIRMCWRWARNGW